MTITEYLTLPLEEQRNILKEQLCDTVRRGEIKEAADAAKMGAYSLYKARDPECESHNLIRPELLAIIHHTGRLGMLDFLDGLFGRVAFTRPQAVESLAHVNRQITAVLRETTEAVQTIIGAVDEGSPAGLAITQGELATIHQEVLEAQQALAQLGAVAQEIYERAFDRAKEIKE